jgi:hypothetical protein
LIQLRRRKRRRRVRWQSLPYQGNLEPGGRTLGEKLAKSLGYRYAHEDMIKEVTLRAKATTRKILDFERRGTTKLTKFLDKIVKVD